MAKLFKNGAVFSADDLKRLKRDSVLSDNEFNEILEKETLYDVPEYEQCRGFLADLRGVAYGNSNIKNSGVMDIKHIAKLLHITQDKANYFVTGCAAWRLTERQGGAWVI